jgi:hypothetical protein
MDAAVVEPSVVEVFPPIQFISFEEFKSAGSFPRFPDNKNICVNLDDIDLENSLLIFISHCWLRGWPGAKGYDGRPHPDNATGDKYELCNEGIAKIMNIYAPGFERCYIWLDYGCINQSADPAGELRQLDKIIGVCDCLFTPNYDADHASWDIPNLPRNPFDFDLSPGWRGNSFSYLNRGWCRVEMFYGANIPFVEDSENRRQKMKAGLLHHRSRGRRPQFVYGSKAKASRLQPASLPPLQNSYFDEYHPVMGNLSVASDKEKIIQLVRDLEPHMRRVNVGIVFHDAAINEGKETYPDGSVYVGQIMNNKPHGYGKIEHADGDMYEGQHYDGKCFGHGRYTYASGSVYEGEYKYDRPHGHGKYTYASGSVYEGNYVEGKRNGHGKYSYLDGSVYEGDYEGDGRNGKGKYTNSDGDVYDGAWKNDVPHGSGSYLYTDGRVTCREYIEGKLVSEKQVIN